MPKDETNAARYSRVAKAAMAEDKKPKKKSPKKVQKSLKKTDKKLEKKYGNTIEVGQDMSTGRDAKYKNALERAKDKKDKKSKKSKKGGSAA